MTGLIKKTEKTSDIIFSDPPYSFNETYLNSMIELVFSENLKVMVYGDCLML